MATEVSSDADQVAAALRAQIKLGSGERLYGVVDAAQDCALAFEAKVGYGKEIRSLFQGNAAPGLAHVAPYLVPIDPDSGYLKNWAARLGKNAGILLTTRASEDELYAHLRKIFVATDEGGQEYFFRFYDPRVLRRYLPTCTPEEGRTFFGPATKFVAEGGKSGTLAVSVMGPSDVSTSTVTFQPVVEPALTT